MPLSSFGDLLEDRVRLRALVETALTQLNDGQHLPQGDPVSRAISDQWSIVSVQADAEVLAAIVAAVPAIHA